MKKSVETRANVETSFRQKIALVLFGLFLVFVVLEAGLRLAGQIILSEQEYGNTLSMRRGNEYRILCLGESTTQNQYPRYLEEILNNKNTGTRFSVIDKGLDGTNTTAILERVVPYLDKYRPDMVVAMMGINDHRDDLSCETLAVPIRSRFIRSFRVYKLFTLLSIHMVERAKEIRMEWQERRLKEATRASPGEYFSIVNLGIFYKDHGRLREAADCFRRALLRDPKNTTARLMLGWIEEGQGNLEEAEEYFKKASESDPKNVWASLALGKLYRFAGEFERAEPCFLNAIQLLQPNPQDDRNYWAHEWLGETYLLQGRLDLAEACFRRSLEFNPKNVAIPSELAVVQMARARDQGEGRGVVESDLLIVPGSPIPRFSYCKRYRGNYNALKRILDERRVCLTSVQYPMCNLSALKSVFKEKNGIVFVDNEKSFQNAVRSEGYDKYFVDAFAGLFGHCTDKGNKLLARNIADVIVREVFQKERGI